MEQRRCVVSKTARNDGSESEIRSSTDVFPSVIERIMGCSPKHKGNIVKIFNKVSVCVLALCILNCPRNQNNFTENWDNNSNNGDTEMTPILWANKNRSLSQVDVIRMTTYDPNYCKPLDKACNYREVPKVPVTMPPPSMPRKGPNNMPSYGPPPRGPPNGHLQVPPNGYHKIGPPKGPPPHGPPNGRPQVPPNGYHHSGPLNGPPPHGPPNRRPQVPPNGYHQNGPPKGPLPHGPPNGRPQTPAKVSPPQGPPNGSLQGPPMAPQGPSNGISSSRPPQ